MRRLDHMLFGYVKYSVKSEDVGTVAQIFLKHNESVKFEGNSFCISARKVGKIDKMLGMRVEFSRTEVLGFGGFIRRSRKRLGAIFALFLLTILYIILQDRVWDIRISGVDAEKEEKLCAELSACGFDVGTHWSKANLSELEVLLLSKSEVASWININRRGVVAYVDVVEKETQKPEEEKRGFSNVVARCDGIIEEIIVTHGIAVVEPGDSVKKGDLLISGVIPSELGGGFCYAEGTVTARVSDTIEIKIPEIKTEYLENKRHLQGVKLKFFDFCVNIFKSYRNLHSDYDIIDLKSDVSLFGKRLPFSVLKRYSVIYQESETAMTAEQMTAEAKEKMIEALSARLSASTLLRIKTSGEFMEGFYIMRSNLVCSENIGSDLAFGATE